MRKIVFATNNAHKLEEVRQILGNDIEVVSLQDIGCEEDIPETADTLEGNALLKAQFVKEHYGYDCFADDTGLEVKALNNEPGVYSARYAGEAKNDAANRQKVLRNLADTLARDSRLRGNDKEGDRSARFRTVIALITDNGRGVSHTPMLFEGIVEGQIIPEERGQGGFGYDSIFVPDGYSQTFAELGADVKNTISHRARAVEKLACHCGCDPQSPDDSRKPKGSRVKHGMILIILWLFCLTAMAQPGRWTSHLAYQKATAMVETPNHIFAIFDGSLLSYAPEDEQVETYSFADGLHDVRIKHIAYSAEANVLVIAYENANIDLFFGKNQVVNIASIKHDIFISDKTVHSVNVIGHEAYLSTGFGIVAIDLIRKEIKGTYKLGVNTYGVCRWEGYFYALTDEGIKRALLSSNLLDKDNWQNYDGDTANLNFDAGKMIAPNDVINALKVNSPANNLFFAAKQSENKLLAVSGGRFTDRYNLPGTLMIYETGKWNTIDPTGIEAQTGLPCLDFISAVVDPRDPNHYFVSSWGEGVYEFKGSSFIQRYSLGNSTLQTANPDYYPEQYVRVDGLTYDRHNNLYMVNASVDKGLSIFTADNKWLSFDYPPLSHVQVNQLLITKNNQKWINIYRTEKTGIFVLNDNNTIDNAADDQYAFSGRFVDQQGTDVGATAYLCLAEDQNGLVWVGTNNGPISFSSADQVGRGQCNRVIAMDENGLNGYHLLEGQTITAIAVDGGNRKWMGTRDNGVFVVDQSDGVLTVENFNTDNSSILSNNITAITIDGETGEVYIATSQGLCSYRGEAIDGKPDFSTVYAYPNPVYPARQSQVVVTGLMQRSTVKITDMAGNLIREGISNGGQFTWNCADSRGNTVKAGIYLVFVSNPDGSSGEVTKIMVIR